MSALSEAERARIAPAEALHRRVAGAVREVVIGQDSAVRLACVTLLCRGHSLIEGVPGLGKTLLVRTLARCLGIRFGRVQFTPDLMPSDVIGTPVLDPTRGEARFRAGPLFTDLLLADEINRAPAKTQAALLEAMQERAATVDGTSHSLGPHFTVFATQNPVEQEGTYPLPEAELDRFLFKIVMDYPEEAQERALLARHHAEDGVASGPAALLSPDELEDARRAVRAVHVGDEITGYVANLVRATRADSRFVLGASPRAGLLLLRASKALAALGGRDFVLPEDVQEAWPATLRHRVVLEPGAEVEGLRADDALRGVLESVTVPR